MHTSNCVKRHVLSYSGTGHFKSRVVNKTLDYNILKNDTFIWIHEYLTLSLILLFWCFVFWSHLVETHDQGFHVRLANDAAASLLSTQRLCVLFFFCANVQNCVCVCVCPRVATHAHAPRPPGVLFKLCIEAWLTSQHTSRPSPTMTSRRRLDSDAAYHRSGSVWGASPRRVCIVTRHGNTLCLYG